MLQADAAARTGYSVSAIRKWRRAGVVADRKKTTSTGLERVEVRLEDVEARIAEHPADRARPGPANREAAPPAGSAIIALADLESLYERVGDAERRADEATARLKAAEAEARFMSGQLAELRRQVQASGVAPPARPPLAAATVAGAGRTERTERTGGREPDRPQPMSRTIGAPPADRRGFDLGALELVVDEELPTEPVRRPVSPPPPLAAAPPVPSIGRAGSVRPAPAHPPPAEPAPGPSRAASPSPARPLAAEAVPRPNPAAPPSPARPVAEEPVARPRRSAPPAAAVPPGTDPSPARSTATNAEPRPARPRPPAPKPTPASRTTAELDALAAELRRLYARLDEYRREPTISRARERQREHDLGEYDTVLLRACSVYSVPTGLRSGEPLTIERRGALTQALARSGLDVRAAPQGASSRA